MIKTCGQCRWTVKQMDIDDQYFDFLSSEHQWRQKKKKKTIIELFNDKHFVITTGTVIPEAKNSTKPNIYSHAQYSEVHAKCNMLQCW